MPRTGTDPQPIPDANGPGVASGAHPAASPFGSGSHGIEPLVVAQERWSGPGGLRDYVEVWLAKYDLTDLGDDFAKEEKWQFHTAFKSFSSALDTLVQHVKPYSAADLAQQTRTERREILQPYRYDLHQYARDLVGSFDDQLLPEALRQPDLASPLNELSESIVVTIAEVNGRLKEWVSSASNPARTIRVAPQSAISGDENFSSTTLKELSKIYVPDDAHLQHAINTLSKRIQGWSGTVLGTANFVAQYMEHLAAKLQEMKVPRLHLRDNADRNSIIKQLDEAAKSGFPAIALQWSQSAESYLEHLAERPLPKANVERAQEFLQYAAAWTFLGGGPLDEVRLFRAASDLLTRLDGRADWDRFSTAFAGRQQRCIERWTLVQQELVRLEQRWQQAASGTDGQVSTSR